MRTDLRTEWVERICQYIQANLDRPLTLNSLGAQARRSPHHLQRSFKRIVGITPRQYADALRIGHLKGLLRRGRRVTEALYEAGYGSSSRLYERAPGHLGMTPANYRLGGQGMRIRYGITDCSLGRLLVGATQRGVCAVALGESDGVLEGTLQREYPNAEILPDSNGLSEWLAAIVRHLNGQEPALDLPVDVQATAFQWRVWQELRKIPYGSTRSYRQIAEALGQPRATRAVARACATNPVAIVIPCHRVIREDGGLGGYRWGLKRKKSLLERERTAAQSKPTASG